MPFSARPSTACWGRVRATSAPSPALSGFASCSKASRASEEFGLAVNRLENARHYLQSGEYGAAHYELRLLRGSLER